jgi:RNA polymerase sigma factor (sigma-70 family)
MARVIPVALLQLFDSGDSALREAGWKDFVNAHTRLLLHVARSFGSDHDIVMDRFTYLLEQLRRDDFRRLRAYAATDDSEFATWLVVVAQRIYRDYERHRYGRFRQRGEGGSTTTEEEIASRRRLVDLVCAEVDLAAIVDPRGQNAEISVRSAEIHRALLAALNTLTPRDQLLLKLRFEDDLDMPEVARVLALPSRFHAYRRLTGALAQLRRALADRGVLDAIP